MKHRVASTRVHDKTAFITMESGRTWEIHRGHTGKLHTMNSSPYQRASEHQGEVRAAREAAQRLI